MWWSDFGLQLGGGRIIFDSPDSFDHLGSKGADIYLVEERIR